MNINLILPNIKPFSSNNAYYKNRKHNAQARKWRATVLKALLPFKGDFERMRDAFNPSLHSLFVSITVYYPSKKFFVQSKPNKGNLSAQTMDLTNTEKLLIDLIFHPKFSSNTWLRERRGDEIGLYKGFTELTNLAIDDRFISDLKSEKRPSEEGYSTEVRISLIPLSTL
jgi:hypothetical protein